ncbi:MAG: tetratricopeptide repeat protein, partial [Bacteroidota bacterium]
TRAEVGKIYQQSQQETPVRQINFRQLAIAAGLILLLTMGLLYFLGPGNIDTVQLAYDNFDAYPDRITAMSDQNLDSLLALGLSAYNGQNYEEAIEAFSGLSNNHPQADLIQLYMGIAQFQTQSPASIASLKSLKEKGGNLESTASWYLALAYLAIAENDLAKAELEFLQQKGDYRNSQVNTLLEQID